MTQHEYKPASFVSLSNRDLQMKMPPLRFSIFSLVAGMTVLAVVIALVQQAREGQSLAEVKQKLKEIKPEFRLRSRALAFVNSLDMESEADRETWRLAKRFLSYLSETDLESSSNASGVLEPRPTLKDLDGDRGNLEILSMTNSFHVSPGNEISVNVLFQGDQVVDILIRNTNARKEMFDTVFDDLNDDGVIDLAFAPFELVFSGEEVDRQELPRIQYVVTREGFERLETSRGSTPAPVSGR